MILFCFVAFTDANCNNDTSKVYITRAAFLEGHPDMISKFPIKEKFWGGWTNFSFQTAGIVRCRVTKRDAKDFAPGSIFAFLTRGKIYVYNDSTNSYVTLVGMNRMLSVYVGEQQTTQYRGSVVTDIFYFSKTVGQGLSVLNEKIIQQLTHNPQLQKLLSALLADIRKKEFDADMHERQFIKVKKLVQVYLKNYETD